MSRALYCLAALAVVGLLVSSAAAQPDSTDVVPPQDGDLRVVPTPGVQADGKLLPEELERRLRERLRQMPAEIPPPSRTEGSRTRVLSTDEAARIHFQAADENEDGWLSAQELERLPATIRELLEARLRRDPAVGLTLQDMRAALVLLESESQRRDSSVPQAQAERRADENMAPSGGRGPGALLPGRPFVEAAREMPGEDEHAAGHQTAGRPLTVSVVLLSRKSPMLPPRTLATEVLEALGQIDAAPNSSLPGRLLAWLAAQHEASVEMLDAFQVQAVAGAKKLQLQRGGREPRMIGEMVQNRDRRPQYRDEEVGTLLVIDSSIQPDSTVMLHLRLEKSFLRQSSPLGRRPSADGDSVTPSAEVSPSPESLEGTATLTAEGVVTVEAAGPTLLSEVIHQVEGQLQEYVILVEARLD